jgi:tetratricopeptide (TPR) repeat protein
MRARPSHSSAVAWAVACPSIGAARTTNVAIGDADSSRPRPCHAADIADRVLVTLAHLFTNGPLGAPLQARWRGRRANLLRQRGRYGDAERIYQAAIADLERARGACNPSLGPLLNGLGIVYKYTGQFDRAEQLYGRALKLAAQHSAGPCQVADLYHNLGGLAHARGDDATGELFASYAVALRAWELGDEHPTVAADKAALAALLDAVGRADEAEALLRKAARVLERSVGANHVDVAASLNNLGANLQRRGKLDEAEHHYRRALAIKERRYGPDHPELTPTLNNLAVVLRRTHRLDDAAALYRRALAILERTVEPDHPNLAACRANFARCLRERRHMNSLRQVATAAVCA